ncbi:FecR family protein [Larkinella bovis]|uniref:FecR family protein n=1 Tax=Larkinella bovis TaxID=683041 RepID=A0ABW0IGI6_9BACT
MHQGVKEESKARDLLKRYREGTLTEQEKAVLESWYLHLGKSRQADINPDELTKQLDQVWEALPVHEPPLAEKTGRLIPFLKSLAVAASVVIVGALGMYILKNRGIQPNSQPIVTESDALPGDHRAKLTLASGQSILLDEVTNGKVAQEGRTVITKTKRGEIVYTIDLKSASTPPATDLTYNTIVTPKAGQYQVKLPDGTNVWLNAASSIRFPTVFSTKERIVEIVGEVYFEVAKVNKNTRRVPFKVLAGKQLIEVLGTRFNVNSYLDEGNVRTTLLEGSIKLKLNGDQSTGILLKPGQQAQLRPGRPKEPNQVLQPFYVKEVDTQSVVAWKDGYFRFDNIGLPELMRQLSRWYDMEVIYEGPIKQYEFVGQIERGTRLSKVLKILELGGVHFRIEGRKIIVIQ